jgi:hypothetical protein
MTDADNTSVADRMDDNKSVLCETFEMQLAGRLDPGFTAAAKESTAQQ